MVILRDNPVDEDAPQLVVAGLGVIWVGHRVNGRTNTSDVVPCGDLARSGQSRSAVIGRCEATSLTNLVLRQYDPFPRSRPSRLWSILKRSFFDVEIRV